MCLLKIALNSFAANSILNLELQVPGSNAFSVHFRQYVHVDLNLFKENCVHFVCHCNINSKHNTQLQMEMTAMMTTMARAKRKYDCAGLLSIYINSAKYSQLRLVQPHLRGVCRIVASCLMMHDHH